MNGSTDLNDRVKEAVRGVSAPPGLEIRIRERIRTAAPQRSRGLWLIPSALAAAAAAVFFVSYQDGHFRMTAGARESYISSVSYRVGAMMRVALGDHIHCAVFRKYPDHPPSPAEFGNELPPEFQGLVPIVRDRVPAQYKLMMAHECSYEGRKFVHLTWKNDAHLLSLLITRRNAGERFQPAPALPPLEDSGIPIYRQGVQRFQIAAFQSGDFLVYFISDLPAQQNNDVMLALAPPIRDFLEHPPQLINRRQFAGLLLSAAVARADDRLEIGGASIEVIFNPSDFDVPAAALMAWVKDAAVAVTSYFGKFPVPSARIRIVQGRRAGVSSGRTFGEGGARTRMTVGQHTSVAQLKEDWTMTHEMVHYAFPSVEERNHWMEEGTATYVEPIARCQVGQLPPQRVWGDMVRDMPQGLPQPGDQGLDNTHTWGRTYWGGAMFCLLADVGIRKHTGNKQGLEDALRAINRAGGTIVVEWPLTKALETGDQATGGTVLMDLYNKLGPKPVDVDLADLWKQLGVSRSGGQVTFDDHAPLAAIRKAIAS